MIYIWPDGITRRHRRGVLDIAPLLEWPDQDAYVDAPSPRIGADLDRA